MLKIFYMIQQKPYRFSSCPRCGFARVCVRVSESEAQSRDWLCSNTETYTYTVLPQTHTHTHLKLPLCIRMTMDRRFITTVMQMLHTHEAVQAGEGGSEEQLVWSVKVQSTLSTSSCTHSVKLT